MITNSLHLIFDFNRVLLFPTKSIPVDLIMSLQPSPSAVGADGDDAAAKQLTHKTSAFDFFNYFEFNEPLFEFLAQLKAHRPNLHLHVFTNSSFSIFEPESKAKLKPLFSQIFAAKDLGWSKDLPASYLKLAEELQIEPSSAFFVDDTLTNVEAAARAGMSTHHFTDNTSLISKIEAFVGTDR